MRKGDLFAALILAPVKSARINDRISETVRDSRTVI